MEKITSLLYKNNISGETGSSKSRSSSGPIHSRPSSAGATRTRSSNFNNRGSAGVTNLYAQSRDTHHTHTHTHTHGAPAMPSGLYGQIFGATAAAPNGQQSNGQMSSGGNGNGGAQRPSSAGYARPQPPQSHAPPTVAAAATPQPLLHMNSLGAATAAAQQNGETANGSTNNGSLPARPRSAGAVRRTTPQGVESSNIAPSAMPAIYSPHNAPTQQDAYPAYYQRHGSTPVNGNIAGSAARPLTAGATATTSSHNALSQATQAPQSYQDWAHAAYKLQYGQNSAHHTTPSHNAGQQSAAVSGPPIAAQSALSQPTQPTQGSQPTQSPQSAVSQRPSSASSKLRQALDLSRNLLHTTPPHNAPAQHGDVPISALLGPHAPPLNAISQPTQSTHTQPTQLTQLTQLTHTAEAGEDELVLGVEGDRERDAHDELDDDEEMDGKRVLGNTPFTAANTLSASQHPEVSLSQSHISHSVDQSALLTQPSHTTQGLTPAEIRNTSLDSFSEDININVGLSTVPNQFCAKRDALELKKLLLLSQGTRGGIVPSSSAVMDMYMVGKVVGVGSYGKVRAAWHRLTGCKVAIKTYDKAKLKDPAHWKRVHSEIQIMEQVSHPRIARMYEAVETPKRMHLIMECLDGGNLCSYVKAKKRLSEDESRRIFFQILQAIEHLHALGVSHRDVKLENVLFVNDREIKLIDFGFSTVCQPGKKLKVFCGTPSYMAPEIVRRVEYEGRPVDMWSMGILLYALLCGCFPFRAKAYPDLYRRIARGTFAIPDELSPPVKDLLRQLLTVDSEQRATAHIALRHSWLQVQLVNAPNMDKMRQEMVVLISEKPADDLDEQVLSELSAFGMSREELVRIVVSKTHCSLATLYYLLLDTIIAKRRLAGNKRAAPSGLGNFSFQSGNSNNNAPSVSLSAALGGAGGSSGRSQSRPKTASALGYGHAQQQAAQSYQLAQPQAAPLQMYVPGMTPQVVSPYEALLQQQQQQLQHTLAHTLLQENNNQQYRPKSASATRGGSTGAQRPLSAYAGRR